MGISTKKTIIDDIRCIKCDKLIAKNIDNKFEIKCIRCGIINDIFDSSNEQVVITDKLGRIMYMNNEAQKITGYSLVEAIGKRPTELWSRLVSSEQFKKFDAKVRSGKDGYSEIIPIETKTGKIFNTSLTVSPIRDSHDEIISFIGIGRLFFE